MLLQAHVEEPEPFLVRRKATHQNRTRRIKALDELARHTLKPQAKVHPRAVPFERFARLGSELVELCAGARLALRELPLLPFKVCLLLVVSPRATPVARGCGAAGGTVRNRLFRLGRIAGAIVIRVELRLEREFLQQAILCCIGSRGHESLALDTSFEILKFALIVVVATVAVFTRIQSRHCTLTSSTPVAGDETVAESRVLKVNPPAKPAVYSVSII
mmetsp:Transcript_29595/g.96373  ORF Transcript_29595/g.96373 Transcript_29595/m.96373 type:complete len:218 (-) Transcript_29595:1923-2576(-)